MIVVGRERGREGEGGREGERWGGILMKLWVMKGEREENAMSEAAGGWDHSAIVKVAPSPFSFVLLSPPSLSPPLCLPLSVSPLSVPCEVNPGPKWEQR